MTIALAVLLTWYVTKVYYTRSLRIMVDNLEAHGLAKVQCSKCSKSVVLKQEHLRTPFFCVGCK